LVALAVVDATSHEWNPDPWVFAPGAALLVWGPRIIPSLVRGK
jgi:hypothetical protein